MPRANAVRRGQRQRDAQRRRESAADAMEFLLWFVRANIFTLMSTLMVTNHEAYKLKILAAQAVLPYLKTRGAG